MGDLEVDSHVCPCLDSLKEALLSMGLDSEGEAMGTGEESSKEHGEGNDAHGDSTRTHAHHLQ